MLHFLDYFFLLFHTALIIFNVMGWMHKRTRKWHLLAISLTLASWFFLGLWKGIGYCPLTDWHWQVLRQLGQHGLPNSYVAYLFDRLLGIKMSAFWADLITVLFAFLAMGASVWLTFFKKKT